MKKYILLLAITCLLAVFSSCERLLVKPDVSADPVSVFDEAWTFADQEYSFFEFKNIDYLSSLFYNLGYCFRRLNNLKAEEIAYLVSLDFVSYYDMVFRMEYAINHLSEHGLYLHFVAPL